MSSPPLRLGIVSALQQEQSGLIEAMEHAQSVHRGMRSYTLGRLGGLDVVCVLSRIGKVAAAATVATLIERFGVTHLIFTGVAGAASDIVQVGDIVIAESLVQHDMDASPLFPRFEIPLTGQSRFATDRYLTEALADAARQFLEQDAAVAVTAADRHHFRLSAPAIRRGLIASGDEFIHSRNRLSVLRAQLEDVLAVEMEGAAVAQVCFEFGVPYAIVRTISDGANEDAPVDFLQFVDRIASRYAFGIVMRLCPMLRNKV
jgi:adenosylhomocysteine nucleosidase